MKTLLTRLAAALMALAFAGAAFAADKGGADPVKEEYLAAARSNFSGCYFEGSAVRTIYEAGGDEDSVGQLGIGAGCDYALSGFLVGAFARADFRDETMISFGPKVGYAINPHLVGYGFLDVQTALDDFGSDGLVKAGVGLETYVSGNFTIFSEVSRDVYEFGDADGLDALAIRFGGRYRFGTPSF